jgi:hypothetical protein
MLAVKQAGSLSHSAELNEPTRLSRRATRQTGQNVKRLTFDGKAVSRAKFAQVGNIANAPAPTSKILAYNQNSHAKAVDEVAHHEFLGRLAPHSFVEG